MAALTKRRIAFVLLAAVLIAARATVARAEQPNYDLKVTFDLSHARIMGTAKRPAQ